MTSLLINSSTYTRASMCKARGTDCPSITCHRTRFSLIIFYTKNGSNGIYFWTMTNSKLTKFFAHIRNDNVLRHYVFCTRIASIPRVFLRDRGILCFSYMRTIKIMYFEEHSDAISHSSIIIRYFYRKIRRRRRFHARWIGATAARQPLWLHSHALWVPRNDWCRFRRPSSMRSVSL